MISGDTIAAIATAPGRSGVAVVRVSGPDAFEIAERLTGRSWGTARGAREVGFARIRPPASPVAQAPSVIDECLLLAFRAPRSYTGEDVVEFQCHGGAVTPHRVLETCLAAGARLARRGEFTERAFLNGKLDYAQAESVLDLVDAKTARAADAALEGLSGRRRRVLRTLYEVALDLSTRLEHALDVDEDELPPDYLPSIGAQVANLRSQLRAALSKAAEGRLLRSGALVVLAGPPNAGKSSLMNAILGENRAIVSDRPGTTRDSIEVWMDLDGWPVRLMDTAGLHETKDDVEAEGIRRARDLVAQADVVVGLGARVGPEDRLIVIHAKCDLGRGEGLNVSARTGEGLDELKRAIVAKLETQVASADSGDAPEGDVTVFHEALRALALADNSDLLLMANAVRRAAERLGTAVGATYSSDMLDKLFSRFCVGK